MTSLALLPADLDVKPFVAGGTMVLLIALERAVPATREGHASWRHDAVNLGVGALNAAVGILLALWALPVIRDARGGLLGVLGVSGPAAFALALLLLDAWMYAWHRAAHAVPLLWRLHRAHHSDAAMDASTAVRFHPLEPALSHVLRVPVALGLGIAAEHVVVYEAVLLPVIIFHHSNLRLPPSIDRLLSWAVVTPGLHRSHHSPAVECRDRNFGSVLSLWDRLLGTLINTCRATGHRFGLDGLRAKRWQGVRGLLATPFRTDDVPSGKAA